MEEIRIKKTDTAINVLYEKSRNEYENPEFTNIEQTINYIKKIMEGWR